MSFKHRRAISSAGRHREAPQRRPLSFCADGAIAVLSSAGSDTWPRRDHEPNPDEATHIMAGDRCNKPS